MVKKESKKQSRSHQVLLGLVELYLESGKPIGSHTLQENGFQNLSSATIRNYLAELEKQGYLKQPHSSGGRIPTNEAFHLYATESLPNAVLSIETEEKLQYLKNQEVRNITTFLQAAAEKLSEVTGLATFLSSVRFDHDLILEIKLVEIDDKRILCVIITDFGQILTEILPIENKINHISLKRIETYLQWRLKGGEKPEHLSEKEEKMANLFYNEVMVRYLVRYSNFSNEDIFRTGFSRLLSYPEFNDPVALTAGLSLFENTANMRLLLNDCVREQGLRFWIGNELASYAAAGSGCSVLASSYQIGQARVGAIGILGPCRMPYKTLFGTLNYFTDSITQALTKSLYKFKISFRQPRSGTPYIQMQERAIVDKTSEKLLEIKEKS